MFERITPEQAGVSSRHVKKYIDSLLRHHINMHSVLMMKGDKLFAEYYWAPFDRDTNHRMYSQTKSYVGVAIGLLEEEGKLSLDDKIVSHFPEKIDGEVKPYLAELTIRDMLMMCTCGSPPYWFTNEDPDRTHLYLNKNSASHPSGTSWCYDSSGSQVLCSLVEKLSGKAFFDYLNEKIFTHLGTFKTATVLKTRNGDSWGDSALVCTPRDMMSFARFVMNYGTWEGERLMNEQYLRTATSNLAPHWNMNFEGGFQTYGYGYQIWVNQQGGFFFNGMGGQFTIAVPEKDLIFVCTADNQGSTTAGDFVIDHFFDLIVDNMQSTPLDEDKDAYTSLAETTKDLKLIVARGEKYSPWQEKINKKTYVCKSENAQGITKFSLHFGENGYGEFRYTNAQGDKTIAFGMKYNEFGKFPQLGYSDEYGTLPTTNGFMYKCAASGAWTGEHTLVLRVQIIDRYLGNFTSEFSFKDDCAVVTMHKNAEAFLEEYKGQFVAFAE
jgi:CubicO group peptidase (beta-lactamase class C family)